ncbi:hypothetical protein CHLRE_07g315650v5 [Chlamydomonas reinhardtii]|uniref:Uncharacterized protein n=1 Tax=Chlamydomonas reinhardtii TaxID=3055 RepID=A0A2K3DIM7_CHLRE|nr:uncharacterized protein CHLRE_07g315650v5 [Chlamydomonas reinhardtii]PNW80393.1 hypothetical protein CHLRE_07g315650v5 [Chlamydomonas reinhardtii]
MVPEPEPGAGDYEQYKDGFHDWLATYWPEPREQLHAGGWRRTAQMLADIKRHLQTHPPADVATAAEAEATSRPASTPTIALGGPAGAAAVPGRSLGRPLEVVDICCGEGGTAVHLAATEGWRVTGVDIVQSAVEAARARAEAYGEVVHVACQVVPAGSCDTADGGSSSSGDVRLRLRVRVEAVSERARFLHASIFKMPLPSASVDVVYGQDPDGLANPDRVHAFREVLRVLRPGGLLYFWHHWVPGPGWPPELLAAYRADPLTGPAPRLSHEEYVQDVQAAGFRLLHVSDCSQLAAEHLGAMAQRVSRSSQQQQQQQEQREQEQREGGQQREQAEKTGAKNAEAGVAEAGASGRAGESTDGPAGEEGWTAIPISGWLQRALHYSALAGGSMGVHVVAVRPVGAA